MAASLQYFDLNSEFSTIVKEFAVGTSDELDIQLIEKSKQPNILKFTPKDSAQRFKSQTTLDEWRLKGREMHWLIGEGGDLAGLTWYGRSEFLAQVNLETKPNETFAIRIYDGYSGHGLARPFMARSLQAHVDIARAEGRPIEAIWLETELDNLAAVSAYEKFGYTEVARNDKRITMILTTETILSITQNS